MKTTDDLDRRSHELGLRLSSWMASTAPTQEPASLVAGAASRTGSVRQRPAVLVRTGLREGAMAVPDLSPRARLLLLAALLLVAVGAAAAVGARLLTPPRPIDQTTTDPAARVYSGSLEQVGSLDAGLYGSAATTLPDGSVLVLVEGQQDPLAEIVDPQTGAVRPAGQGAVPVAVSKVVTLSDGRILILGWAHGPTENTGRPVAQLYDPKADTFTTAGAMTTPRLEPAAVRLADGRVLITGGWADETGVPIASAEIYDPERGTFSPTGKMLAARSGQFMTLLADGRVLVVGGTIRQPQAEIYEPSTGTFRPAGPRVETRAFRGSTTARVAPIRLPDGRILVFGVQGPQYFGRHGIDSISAEFFDPASDTFSAAPPIPHDITTATLLDDGRVLLSGHWQAIPEGGCDARPATPEPRTSPPHDAGGGCDSISDSWIGTYDPKTGDVQMSLDPMTGVSTLPADTATDYAAAVRLDDGRVLLVGAPDGTDPAPGPSVLDIFE